MKVVSPPVAWWLSILHSALCLAIKRALRVEYCRLTSRKLFNNLRDVYTKSFELHQGGKSENPQELT